MKQATVMNKNGIHARPASEVVSVAKKFPGEVFLQKDGIMCNAKSIMMIMRLNLIYGDRVDIIASGDGAEKVEAAIRAIVENIDE